MGILASIALWCAEGCVTGLTTLYVFVRTVLAGVLGSTYEEPELDGLRVDVFGLLCVPGAISHGFA